MARGRLQRRDASLGSNARDGHAGTYLYILSEVLCGNTVMGLCWELRECKALCGHGGKPAVQVLLC